MFTTTKSIPELLEQYRQLKHSKAALDKRLEELRTTLIYHPKIAHIAPKHGFAIQTRNLTTFDADKVWELMDSKAIPHDQFTKKVIEPSLVEQLYWDGKLDDSDLRYIRVPKYTYALKEVEPESV